MYLGRNRQQRNPISRARMDAVAERRDDFLLAQAQRDLCLGARGLDHEHLRFEPLPVGVKQENAVGRQIGE